VRYGERMAARVSFLAIAGAEFLVGDQKATAELV
jgi:hypothetical protein